MIKTQDKMGKVASWVVVDKATGKPVAEIYEQRTVERINTEKYEIWTAYEWMDVTLFLRGRIIAN